MLELREVIWLRDVNVEVLSFLEGVEFLFWEEVRLVLSREVEVALRAFWLYGEVYPRGRGERDFTEENDLFVCDL